MAASFKYTEQQNRQLRNEVRKFNRKIERLGRNNPNLVQYLPEKRSVRGIKQNIGNKRDLNAELRSLERFLKPGAETLTRPNEFGQRLTRYELKDVKLRVNRINTRTKNYAEALDLEVNNGNFRALQDNNLLPREFNFQRSRNPMKKIKALQNMQKVSYYEEAEKQYRENYHKALREEFKTFSEDVIKALKNIPTTDFVFYSIREPHLRIKYIYDPIMELEHVIDILETWDRYEPRKEITDLLYRLRNDDKPG